MPAQCARHFQVHAVVPKGPPHSTGTDMLINGLILFVFPAAMAFAAASDLVSMTISNRLSVGLAAAFFFVAALVGMPLDQMAWHLGAGFLVLTICFVLFAFGWIGGGDAKLAGATALWLGFANLPEYLVVSSFLGGMLTLLLLLTRDYPLPRFLHRQEWALRVHSLKDGIPYGIALAAGGLLVYPSSLFMQALGG